MVTARIHCGRGSADGWDIGRREGTGVHARSVMEVQRPVEPLEDGAPRAVGEYRLLGRIGSGGMGQVYLGESPAGQHVAVKMIKPSVLDEDTRARFILEVESLRTVYGTGVAAFVGADAHADAPWLAVEYVPGPDLRSFITEHGPLPPVETASLGALLAEGLKTVHEAGLLHRDLKPQNILLSAYGPKVIDFGLAVLAERRSTLTATGVVVGSVQCMPPEQARGEQHLEHSADVYALGAVLLYAATGHYPYTGPTWQAIALRIEDPATTPDLQGLSPQLRPVIEAMLAHDPADRPSRAKVTERLVGVITEHGLTVGQARRRLTARVPPPPELPEAPLPDYPVYTPTVIDPAAQPLPGEGGASPDALIENSGEDEDGTAQSPEDVPADGTPRGAAEPPSGSRSGIGTDAGTDTGAGTEGGTGAEPRSGSGSGPVLPTARTTLPFAVPLRIAERMRAAYAREARF